MNLKKIPALPPAVMRVTVMDHQFTLSEEESGTLKDCFAVVSLFMAVTIH